MTLLIPGLTGFATAFSLILAIGTQNAFVLRQGLRQSHVFAVCLVCAVSDAILITLGVGGFGAIVHAVPALPIVMRYAGAAFLFAYGARRFRAAWRGGESLDLGGSEQDFWPVILTCLAFTWLNPHVYLDTFGLIGAVSTGFPPMAAKLAFGLGAIAASFTFFFGLGYGARLLAPLMQSETVWRILDTIMGSVMWALAVMLVTTP